MYEPVIVGEVEAGQAAKVRQQLESLITSVNRSTFDIGELLHVVKRNSFYAGWGFNTFQEYVDSLDIKARKAQYLVRIVDVMDKVDVKRDEYEPLGIAKLREITSLEPGTVYKNPETGVETPVTNFIVGFIEKGKELTLEEVKQHVRTIKGLTGENELVWLNFSVKKSAVEETIKPALQLAKANIGTVAKDSDGMGVDASDGAALEAIAVEYLNDPANSFLAGQDLELKIEPDDDTSEPLSLPTIEDY